MLYTRCYTLNIKMCYKSFVLLNALCQSSFFFCWRNAGKLVKNKPYKVVQCVCVLGGGGVNKFVKIFELPVLHICCWQIVNF